MLAKSACEMFGEQDWVLVENYKGSFPIDRVDTLSV